MPDYPLVHDELMFEWPVETTEEPKAEITITFLMEHSFPTDFIVPLQRLHRARPAWEKAK